MPLFHFSDEFKARVSAATAPLSVRVLREVAESGDTCIESMRCLRCGFSKTYSPPKPTKATALRDCEWTHEFSWETGQRCGGQIAFITSPLLMKVGPRLEEVT